MDNSKLVLGSQFSKYREHPKWVVNLILWLIAMVATVSISATITDWTAVLQQTDNSMGQTQLEQAKSFMVPFTIFSGIFGTLFYLLFAYLIVWGIARIFKSDVRKRSIFAGTVFALLISALVGLVVMIIQAIVGLDPIQTSITSLNVFSKGNKMLGAFNLQTLLSGYLLGLLLYKTCKLSGKVSIIFGVLFVVISIGFTVLGASFQP